MSHILAETFIVFAAIGYFVLAIPLIVWAFNPQWGTAIIGRMITALGRVPKRVHRLMSCIKDTASSDGRNHDSKLSEARAHR